MVPVAERDSETQSAHSSPEHQGIELLSLQLTLYEFQLAAFPGSSASPRTLGLLHFIKRDGGRQVLQLAMHMGNKCTKQEFT